MRKPILRVAAAALAVGLMMAGCGGKREANTGASGSEGASCEASDGRITIATGDVGGPFYVIGGGLAQLISDNTKLRATAAETGGSLQNIQQLADGTYDIAFAQADIAADAVAGKGGFDGKPQQIQALARLYLQYVHVVVRIDAGINSVTDLRGKRVSTGAPKSGAEVISHRLLRSAGLDPEKDIQAQRLDLNKTADAMKTGTIDAFIISPGIPTAQVTDIMTSVGDKVKFLDVSSQLDEMKKINAAHVSGVIPAAVYKLPADVPTIATPTLLLARDDFSTSNACAITKLVFTKKETLEQVHPAAKEIQLDKAKQTEPVTLHPGAEQALGELGAS